MSGTTEHVSRVEAMARRLAGPTGRRRLRPVVLRLRRERDWYRHRRLLQLAVAAPDGFPFAVADHSTPLIRHLAGLEPRLQTNKVTNLRLAVAPLDGRVLAPGQRLSFWRFVGRPSAGRGFVEGLVLDDGRLVAGVGGGLCQLTNLVHWMTLHTPLTVVERWRHTYDVFPDADRTQPFGSGATCSWPSLDLQVENRTDTAFRLSLAVGVTHLSGAWTAECVVPQRYRVYEAAHVITSEGSGVFVRHNLLRREIRDAGGTWLGDELVTENHALMRYQPFLTATPHIGRQLGDPCRVAAPTEPRT
jgi:vancomycin resistance protein VanW